MALLPVIMAGPILRRVEKQAAFVWLATSQRLQLKLEIFASVVVDNAIPVQGAKLSADGAGMREVMLGDKLFVYLLEAKPVDLAGFPEEEILFYKISSEISPPDLNANLDLLNLPLQGWPLPSFIISHQLKTILHASCRKPHGEGQDALPVALDHLQENATDLEKRPTTLFLTGDQIYADDVSGNMIRDIIELAQALTNWQEVIPGLGATTPADLSWESNLRAAVIKEKALFSTEAGANHLMTFGEFAAMYCMVWNEHSWLKGVTAESLSGFHSTLPKVRTLLANVPTYMIFDDHEVTDDWNIDKAWEKRVLSQKNPAGRRIIANALAAYWAFQGWGNSPDDFDDNFTRKVSDHLCSKGVPLADGEFEKLMLSSERKWQYALPTQPPVLVLNTRTRRKARDNSMAASNRAPRLMDDETLDWIKTVWTDSSFSGDLGVIVISPTPVYGFSLIERLQDLGNGLGISTKKLDREAWIANPKGYFELMQCIVKELNPKRCTFLSGDVHYSFTTKGQFKLTGHHEPLEVIQCTSSPQKNRVGTHGKNALAVLDLFKKNRQKRAGWNHGGVSHRPTRNPDSPYAWEDEVVYQKASSGRSLVTGNNVGLVRFDASGAPDHLLLNNATPGIPITFSAPNLFLDLFDDWF